MGVMGIPNIIRKGFTYLLFGGLNALLGLLFLPVITRYLTPEDYGIVSIFTVSVMFLGMLTRLETQAAVKRLFHESTVEEISKVINTSLTLTLAVFCFYLLSNLVLSSFYSNFFGVPKNWVWALIFLGLSGALSALTIALYSIKDKPLYVGLWQTLFTLINYGLAVYFIVYVGLGWAGRLWPLVIVGAGQVLFGVWILASKFSIKPKISLYRAKDILKYSLPIVPATLGAYFLMSLDRFFISEMAGLKETGIYASASQIVLALVIVYNSFMPTWEAWVFRNLSLESHQNKKRALMILAGFVVGFGFLCFAFSQVIILVIPYVLGDRFQQAAEFVPALSVVIFGRAFYYAFSPLINFSKMNKIFTPIMISMVSTNCILNYIFILKYGIVGAAYATACSYFVGLVIALIAAEKRLSFRSAIIAKN